MSTPTGTIMRYPGGKWRLAPWIIAHFPPHRIYVEPYGGSASVLLRKERASDEVLNDCDGDIVNLYRVLRDPDQASRLRDLLDLTPYAREEFVGSYEPSVDAVEQARRTLVRAVMGFGVGAMLPDSGKTGLRTFCRTGRSNPAHEWALHGERIAPIAARLRGVLIEHDDALDVIRRYDRPDTLHYVDPPYVTETRAAVIYRYEMDDDGHRALGECLRAVQGMVVVSGYDCPLYRDIFQGWRCVRRDARADGARAREECLWLNARCDAAATRQERMFA